MGHSTAKDAADLVAEGAAPLRMAIAMNLQSNHFPPIPDVYVDYVGEAIEAAQEDEPDRQIDISRVADCGMVPSDADEHEDGTLWITASALLDVTHSWPFVQVDDDLDMAKDEDWDLDGPAHVREV